MTVKEMQEHNKKVFSEKGMRNSGEYRHYCIICGNQTNIDGSISDNGKNLICLSCMRKKFGDYVMGFSFVNGKEQTDEYTGERQRTDEL